MRAWNGPRPNHVHGKVLACHSHSPGAFGRGAPSVCRSLRSRSNSDAISASLSFAKSPRRLMPNRIGHQETYLRAFQNIMRGLERLKRIGASKNEGSDAGGF